MKRNYVEFGNGTNTGSGSDINVMARNPEHVKEMFPLFNIVAIDQVD